MKIKKSLTLLGFLPLFLVAGCTNNESSTTSSSVSKTASTISEKAQSELTVIEAVVPNPLPEKNINQNPYMGSEGSNIHEDSYNTDITDAVLPLGINPEVNTSYEKQNGIAPPALFYDSEGHAYCPLLGGLAIRDMDSEEITTLGAYIPAQHDEKYVVQSSYSFVDGENRLVCPTNDNHIIIFQTLAEDGTVLPEFEKLLDIDVKAQAEKKLGITIDQNLLSIVYDFEGNLWFVTGGYRIYPERKQTGVVGYISHQAIADILDGKTADLDKEIHVMAFEAGEGAENGIASCQEGTVVLTNKACYLFKASDSGVEEVWKVPYDSVGAHDSSPEDYTTGGGLAWGGGASPSLSDNLALFCDNADPIHLIAVDLKTGEVVASLPLFENVEANISVENSINVYSGQEGQTSVIICNWFGAGSPDLANPDSDSSVQSYSNLYDSNWIAQGNSMIEPGMQRVDIIKDGDEYKAESVWIRDDIRDTSIFRLSTATGQLYGYVQDLDTGMWQYIVLDFDTGETLLTVDVSNKPEYNNMAIGMFSAPEGNALYCPTGTLELLRLQDRFVYLPDSPYRQVNLDKTSRRRLTEAAFQEDGGQGTPVSFVQTAAIENVPGDTKVAFQINGLSGNADDLSLYAYTSDGSLKKVEEKLWSINGETLEESTVYDLIFTVSDDGDFDLDSTANDIQVSVVLAKE